MDRDRGQYGGNDLPWPRGSVHDHMLHRTGLLTEAQVRGSKALLPRTCASVNNPVL